MSDDSTKRVKEEALNGMVVERAESVRNVKSMVDRVDLAVQVFVLVEQAVEEVLPGIENDAATVQLRP